MQDEDIVKLFDVKRTTILSISSSKSFHFFFCLQIFESKLFLQIDDDDDDGDDDKDEAFEIKSKEKI